MAAFNRRTFLGGLAASATAAATVGAKEIAKSLPQEPRSRIEGVSADEIDFRYRPRLSQATICFPDDPKKSLVGQRGDLRYGFAKALMVGMEDFATVCTFSLAGMQDDRVERQWLEAASVPVVHTLISRSTATLELVAFATRHGDEGRVDNVLMTIAPKGEAVVAMPRIHIRGCATFKLLVDGPMIVAGEENSKTPFLVAARLANPAGGAVWWEEAGYTLYLPHGEASRDKPLQYLVRFPQDGQPAENLQTMLEKPEALLEECREFWKNWKPFGSVSWSYPGKPGEFLTACARNIQQAREVKNNRLVFQVGPTVYRGLWIVDGNFLLEAARYLGYDKEADDGLQSEWAKQLPSGQVVAAVPGEHWKDTAIAMFTLVRQCELKQDWQFFKDLEPNLRKAIEFLARIRDEARKGNSTNGKYGILPPGFADGGIGGVRSEFTNTVWTLAGLKAVAAAAERLGMNSLTMAKSFYHQLRVDFLAAAKSEMVRHPNGFEYLPMLSKDDPEWHDPDPWTRPRPQTAQWALSHAIFPGCVFDRDDPIVRGQIALLQSCTQEDIPAETGWLWHDSVWNYNASFAAHVYLWAGLPKWADRAFRGFLNHASPLYCWREEQPLQHALVGQDWGDMPHNWASAECIRYLRHMLVLEDGDRLRLLEGIISRTADEQEKFHLERTPTRFGRVTLDLEPLPKSRGWKVDAVLDLPQSPGSVEIPPFLGGRRLNRVEGATYKVRGGTVFVHAVSTKWTAFWQ
jgi:hypothetical protein